MSPMTAIYGITLRSNAITPGPSAKGAEDACGSPLEIEVRGGDTYVILELFLSYHILSYRN